MMGIEEEGMDEYGFIPEHARAHGETISLELQKRSAVVRCRQNVREPVGGYKIRTTVIS